MPIKLCDAKVVYRGYSTVREVTVTDDSGATYVREIEDHGQAVAVLPYDPERRLALLVRLPRAPVVWAGGPAELLEAPAGMIDEGSPDDAVRREALEEAGVRLGELQPLGAAFSTAGVSTERLHLYLARYTAGDRVQDGGGVDGEHENITVVEMPLAELRAQLDAGRIEDLKTVALLYALRVRQPHLFEA